MSKKAEAQVGNSAETVKTTPISETGRLAGAGLSTEKAMDNLLDAIVNDLNANVGDYEKTRYLLSAIGKKLAKENIKIRAGFYRNKDGAKKGLFLGE